MVNAHYEITDFKFAWYVTEICLYFCKLLIRCCFVELQFVYDQHLGITPKHKKIIFVYIPTQALHEPLVCWSKYTTPGFKPKINQAQRSHQIQKEHSAYLVFSVQTIINHWKEITIKQFQTSIAYCGLFIAEVFLIIEEPILLVIKKQPNLQ